jgi:hypothetical protein
MSSISVQREREREREGAVTKRVASDRAVRERAVRERAVRERAVRERAVRERSGREGTYYWLTLFEVAHWAHTLVDDQYQHCALHVPPELRRLQH